MSGGNVVVLGDAMLPDWLKEKIESLTQGVNNLQDVVAATAFIQDQLRLGAFTNPEDRDPLTIIKAANPISVDPAIAGGEVVAGAGFQPFVSYEVPDGRIGWILEHSGYGRVITVLGAAQSAFIGVRITPPSSDAAVIYRMVPAALASAAGTQLFLPATCQFRLLPRWKIEVGALLTAGAGTMRFHGSLSALEYNK